MSYLFFQILVGVFCFILGIVIFLAIKKLTNLRGNLECIVILFIGIPFVCLFFLITEDWVSIIYSLDSSEDEPKEYVSFSKSIIYRDSLDNAKYFDLEPGSIYVINNTSEAAVFYPVAYGNATINDNDVVYILANSVSSIPNHIDYYFNEPDAISVDQSKSGEVRYVLDWLDHALEE